MTWPGSELCSTFLDLQMSVHVTYLGSSGRDCYPAVYDGHNNFQVYTRTAIVEWLWLEDES